MSLTLTTHNDGRHERTAIVADDEASFVIVGKDGRVLFMVNAFDHDEGHGGTCDVFVPAGTKARVMLFERAAYRKQRAHTVTTTPSDGRRVSMEYDDTRADADPDWPPSPWSPPHAVINLEGEG